MIETPSPAGRAWRRAGGVLVCEVLGLLCFSATWGEAIAAGTHEGAMSLDVVLGIVGTVLVSGRHRWPTATAVVLVMASIGSSWLAPAVVLAVASVASTRRSRQVALVAAAWGLALAVSLLLSRRDLGPTVLPHAASAAELLTSALAMALIFVCIVALAWNRSARQALAASRRAQAATLGREQAARVAQAQLAERARIAREMHDVLAHKMSLISLHSGVLAYQDALTDEERAMTAATIQETSHQALEELRAVLGVLRDDASTPLAPPQPSLLDLPTLIAQEEAAGASITLDVAPDFFDAAARLPADLSRHAQRIAQEALTNARKHAAGRPVTVRAEATPGCVLSLRVSNPLGSSASVPGARLGLQGLAERAALVGGRLVAGPRDGVFVLEAHLPWTTEEEGR